MNKTKKSWNNKNKLFINNLFGTLFFENLSFSIKQLQQYIYETFSLTFKFCIFFLNRRLYFVKKLSKLKYYKTYTFFSKSIKTFKSLKRETLTLKNEM